MSDGQFSSEEEVLQAARLAHQRSVHEVLDIEVVRASAEEVVMRMPITWKAHQPTGILHGGVSCVLAESAGSLGAALNAPGKWVAGIELNISHLRAVSSGTLTAHARPIRVGSTVQVWDIDLMHDSGRQVAKARLTVAVREAPSPAAAPGE